MTWCVNDAEVLVFCLKESLCCVYGNASFSLLLIFVHHEGELEFSFSVFLSQLHVLVELMGGHLAEFVQDMAHDG